MIEAAGVKKKIPITKFKEFLGTDIDLRFPPLLRTEGLETLDTCRRNRIDNLDAEQIWSFLSNKLTGDFLVCAIAAIGALKRGLM